MNSLVKTRTLFYLILCISFLSCQSGITYSNKSKACILTLKDDSTYTYKMPLFFRQGKENGTWNIIKDTLVLKTPYLENLVESKRKSGFRKYIIKNNEIIINDISPKLTGLNYKIMYKE